MLEKVGSDFFCEKIFSFIDEKQKLKIIRYNKILQKITNISISNYIHFKGEYIIYDSNDKRKRKTYDKLNNLTYDGEYLHCERNGKGKEINTYNDNLIFEGEYLNGKGKEYYDNSKLLFEGEYLNGKRNGKGKQYYYDGKLEFEGEYLDGEKIIGTKYDQKGNIKYEINNLNGKGKEYNYFNDKVEFEGEYLKGKRNGKGKEFNDKGNIIFEGEYLNGKRWNGKGYDGSNNIVYELKEGKSSIKEYGWYGSLIFEGEYLNGEKNGKGKQYDNQTVKLLFEGEYLNGKRHGKGKEFYFVNGKLLYEGEYKNEQRNGKGKEYDTNGKLIFEGEYLYNYKIKGKYYINEKLEFEGDFRYDKKWNGKGYDDNGQVNYELINGKGRAKEYNEYKSYLKFEGEYLNGERNGKGKEYDEKGEIIFEGEYLNGKRK